VLMHAIVTSFVTNEIHCSHKTPFSPTACQLRDDCVDETFSLHFSLRGTTAYGNADRCTDYQTYVGKKFVEIINPCFGHMKCVV
jgi:hypothetical protein